jgi:hypothetical protein
MLASELFFIQRGGKRASGAGVVTHFAVSKWSDGNLGVASIEQLAERIGTNISEADRNNKVVLNHTTSKYTVHSDGIIDDTFFQDDLEAAFPTVYDSYTRVGVHPTAVCKYD